MSGDDARYFTVDEVAELTGLSAYQVRKAKDGGLLPWHPVGDRPLVRFTKADLDEWKRLTRVTSEPSALITTRRKKRPHVSRKK